MFRGHGTGQFHFVPFKLARRSAFQREQTVPKNYRRNFRSGECGKIPPEFRVSRHAAHLRENIKQFAAVAAEDGLHAAIHTALRPAGNGGAILALRTFKMKCLAHNFQIWLEREKFQAGDAGLRSIFADTYHEISTAAKSFATSSTY
jgi:hypothetical protein